MEKILFYEIYESPKTPTENGLYIGKTPVLEQAVGIIEKAKELGKICFIKCVK